MARRLLGFIRFLSRDLLPATYDCSWQPAVDLYRTKHGWLVKVELAGVHRDDVEVAVGGRTLMVRGLRRDNCLDEDAYHYSMEIAYSHFSRFISLPCDLDHADVAAEQRDGMLMIRIRTEREA